ncbi:MAG: DUF1318 domain-containing protein [Nitrospirota bacterium]
MRGQFKKIGLVTAVSAVFIITACAVITVNIYFPEKDVKTAYKSLEEELMKGQAAPEKKETPEKQPEKKTEPQSYKGGWIGVAEAQEDLAQRISEIIKTMPDVVQAYKEMGARLSQIDNLRNQGLVGEGNNGLLAPRGSLNPKDASTVNAENANRNTVIRGMARAIVRINKLPENEANISQVLKQAADQFSALRREGAKAGWWIQRPDGGWVKK